MNSIDKLNKILDISDLPSEIRLAEEFEVAILLTLLNDYSNSDYIPRELEDLLNSYYKNSEVNLFDSEPKADCGYKFVNFGGKKLTFDRNMVDELIEKDGLWGFVAEFEKDGTFVIGLDQEYIMILSPKESGFISKHGGKDAFYDLALKRFKSGQYSMDKSAFCEIMDCVYGINRGRAK